MERYRGTSEDYWVCVHARPDVISDRVRHKGVWDDCEDQVWLLWTLFGGARKGVGAARGGTRAWMRNAAGSGAREGSAAELGRALSIVEVGANIGVCSVRLAKLGHKVWSFEPVAENFARLEGSVAINKLEDRVFRFQVGAADEAGARDALVENGNAGNTVLIPAGARPPDEAEQAALASGLNSSFVPTRARVARLDDLLRPKKGGEDALMTGKAGQGVPGGEAGGGDEKGGRLPGKVDLLQLDCQGCEVDALQGADALIEEGRVETIVVEYSPAHLSSAGHRPEALLEMLHARGFRISTLLLGTQILPESFRAFVREHEGVAINLLARREDPGAPAAKRGGGGWGDVVREAVGQGGKGEEGDPEWERKVWMGLCLFAVAFGVAGICGAWVLLGD